MKVYFDTVGCRLNQAEIETMAAQFRAAGHTILESAEGADLVVVNTCAVTAAAASDSRQKVRQAFRSGAHEIVYTGCLATLEPEDGMRLPGVSQVIPNDQKDNLVSSVLGLPQVFDLEPLARKPLPGIHKRTRAFIKAQDGCDNFCTYCITRIARGQGKSVDEEVILKEVKTAEAGGAHEVVLSGVNLGSWGKDLGDGRNLTWLIRYLLNESDIERIRLSSTEPWDLDEAFFAPWQNKRMCRHLHLPLQSGSAGVLRRMVRNTTPEKFQNLVDLARSMIPGLALTTDVIVGFPGETEAEFEESLALIHTIGFSGGHVFKYSPREGTAAAKLPGRIHGNLAAERSRKMRAALTASENRFYSGFVGAEMEVLWETVQETGSGTHLLHGLTDNYLQVQAMGEKQRTNTIDQVRIQSFEGGILQAEIIESTQN